MLDPDVLPPNIVPVGTFPEAMPAGATGAAAATLAARAPAGAASPGGEAVAEMIRSPAAAPLPLPVAIAPARAAPRGAGGLEGAGDSDMVAVLRERQAARLAGPSALTLDERARELLRDASLHYVLPSHSLSPLLHAGLLSAAETS
jgi:hypothetical protein